MSLNLVIITGPIILLPLFIAFGLFCGALFRDGDDNYYLYLSPVLGAGIVVVLLKALTQIGFQILTSTGIILVLAIGGLVFAIFRLGSSRIIMIGRQLLLPLLLFVISYSILMSPFLIKNHVGVSGYNVSNDSVVHTILADDISSNGSTINKPFIATYSGLNSGESLAPHTDNSSSQVISTMLSAGYPIGYHLVLGMLSSLAGRPSFYLFNSVAATFVSLSVFVFYFLARYLKIRRWLVPIASLSITLAYLTVGYYLQGFAPQVSLTPFLYASLLSLHLFYRKSPAIIPGSIAVITILASLIIYSFSFLLWIIPFVFGTILINLRRERIALLARKTFMITAIIIIGAMFTVLPTLIPFFGPLRNDVFSKTVTGNLLGKISIFTASGVWISADYRLLPRNLMYLQFSHLFGAAFLILAFFGIVKSIKNGAGFIWLTAFISTGAIIFLDRISGPYYYSKALQFGAPAFGMAAFYGFDSMLSFINDRLLGKKRRVLQALLITGILVYLVAFFGSDYLELKAIALSPKDKFDSLGRHGESIAGKGPILFLEKEDWGKYFLKNNNSSSLLDGAYRARATDLTRQGIDEETADFDGIDYSKLDLFQYVICANRNIISLPNPSFTPISGDEFYTVFKRNGKIFNQVIEHLPAESLVEPEPTGGVVLQPDESLKVGFRQPISTGHLALSAYANPDIALTSESFNLGQGWEVWAENKQYLVNKLNSDVPLSGLVTAKSSGGYDIYIQGEILTNLNISVGDRNIFHRVVKETILTSLSRVGSIRLEKNVPTTLRISVAKNSPANYNHLRKVILVAKNRSGAGLIRISEGGNDYNLTTSLTPGIIQLTIKDSENEERKIITIQNGSNLPLNFDWVESLRSPYSRAITDKYNNYYAANTGFKRTWPW